jgi:signal transduction histidine kinase
MFPVSFNQKIQWLILLSARDGSGDYNSEDLQLITTISGQLAMALQKADAFRSLQKTNITLQQTIGELKATQLELARQERLAVIGRMAASIAHEVRNPLGVIKISARTLSNQFTEKESSARELADFINNEVDKLNRVVSDLLDFTREPARNFRPESMTTLIKNAQERAKTYGEVKIHFREPIEDIICDIDRDPMERVLTNLLINAIEATTDKDNGIVEIAISKHAKKVKIMVSDHGSGIHKEDQNNIFEPFFTTRQNGTGLGLAISARIISGHHGEIFVDKNYRNGCRMIIELPLHQSKS